jgi:hypothetical protein
MSTKKTNHSDQNEMEADDLLPEYHFDYSQAHPNRFAGRGKKNVVVVLDDDVAQTFTTPEAVNNALRALITALPQAAR